MDVNGLAPIRKLDIGILRKALNTDNINTDDSKIKNKGAELLPEIFRLIASLEDDTQKMLLDSWAKMKMPLSKKTLRNLIAYLDNNPTINSEDKMAVIKAFAFLESNNLPLSEKFITALRTIFNNNENLSSDFEEFINSENFLNTDQIDSLLTKLSLEDLKQSLLNIDNSSQQNQEIKDILLSDSENLRQNFDQNTVKILNNFILNNNINGINEEKALLKAFAFLENNKLPITESLIKEMTNNFKKNIIQYTDNLNNKNQIFDNLINLNSELITKNEAAVNLNASTNQIKDFLAVQNTISDQILKLFNKSDGKSKEKIADNLLGQKLVNLQQQQNQNSPLILALEIPLQMPDNKLSSLLLKIEKEKEKNKGSKDAKNKMGYNISFILEFKNIGLIQTNVNIKQNNINTTFYTENSKTANLIEKNLDKLNSSLEENGFTIQNFTIENLDNLKEEKSGFFNNLILNKLNDQNNEGKYQHIDIKI